MKAFSASLLLVAALCPALGCGQKDAATAAQERPAKKGLVLPTPAEPLLAAGKAVYEGTCMECHNTGMQGAPRLTNHASWTERLKQERPVLHKKAVEGFFGPNGDEMPARGGNKSLTDEQVAQAVDYIAWAVEQLNQQQP